MEYQNVTLSIPKEVLKKAKTLAIEQGCSLSGLLSRLLEELVRKRDTYSQAREHHLAVLDMFDLGTGGCVNWSRDDLHENEL
jgi:metal-responsive CopG/Arc/MetJ family transcriptional regulator